MYCTFQELGQLVEVSDGEFVEVLAGPDREEEDGGAEAGGDADDDGGEALVREADELVDAVARHGHQAEGEDEDGHAVVVPRLHLRDEARERRRRRCSTMDTAVMYCLVKKVSAPYTASRPGAFAWHTAT